MPADRHILLSLLCGFHRYKENVIVQLLWVREGNTEKAFQRKRNHLHAGNMGLVTLWATASFSAAELGEFLWSRCAGGGSEVRTWTREAGCAHRFGIGEKSPRREPEKEKKDGHDRG